MQIWRIIKLGLDNLYLYKLRSLSTILGIVFGVAAVIAMLSIGAGAKQETLQQIAFLGIKNICIKHQKMAEKEIDEEVNKQIKQGKTNISISFGLEEKQIRHLKSICPNLEFIASTREILVDITSPVTEKKLDLKVIATGPAYEYIMDLGTEKGRFVSYLDIEQKEKVCVIGAEAKRKVFFWRDPIGQFIRIGNHKFKVVGVVKKKDVPKGAVDINKCIYIPFSTSLQYFGKDNRIKESRSYYYKEGEGSGEMYVYVAETPFSETWCRVKDEKVAEQTGQIIRRGLIKTNPKGNFDVIVPQELLAQSERTEWLFTIVMGSIAAISLLVGGIGVMNTMLATISERTREIGLRRAIGAKKRDIIKQFVVETLVLTVGGGMLGIGLGIGLSKIIPVLVPTYITIISVHAVIIAFSVSVVIGIVFGLYPAYRAARINPIEALKYE